MEQFTEYNLEYNDPLRKYVEKCTKDQEPPKYSLPESERIYYKDFHFLDEPLADKQKKKEEIKKAKKLES